MKKPNNRTTSHFEPRLVYVYALKNIVELPKFLKAESQLSLGLSLGQYYLVHTTLLFAKIKPYNRQTDKSENIEEKDEETEIKTANAIIKDFETTPKTTNSEVVNKIEMNRAQSCKSKLARFLKGKSPGVPFHRFTSRYN